MKKEAKAKFQNAKRAAKGKAQGGDSKKAIMCKSFRHYGFALLGIGTAFLILNLILGASSMRIAIVAFFVGLGLVDLLFFAQYGEK